MYNCQQSIINIFRKKNSFQKRNILFTIVLPKCVWNSQNYCFHKNDKCQNFIISLKRNIIIFLQFDIFVMTPQFDYSHYIISKSCVYKSFKSTNQRLINMSIVISTVQMFKTFECSTVHFDINSIYQSFRYYHFKNTCSQIS